MEIKRESEKKKYLASFFKYLYNRKTKIFYKLLFVIIFLIVGIFIGLLIAGFFGTLDSPSQKVISFVQGLGIRGFGLQEVGKGIIAENIKIPFNYIKGLFSNPKKVYIDVAFQDWQKIEYIRERALERGMLLAEEDDWVNAVVSDGTKKVNAKIRLKGDNLDHWTGDKWSFRIKVSGDETLFGMKEFSIQHPKTRSYIYEKLYELALKKEDVLSVRYDFVEVRINGKNKGIYALEEHFTKNLLESNNKRDGPIIRFEDTVTWLEKLQDVNYFSKLTGRAFDYFLLNTVDSFQSQTSLQDPVKSAQFDKAKDLLESFRLGKLKTSRVFDVDLLAKYFAVNTVTGAIHASISVNIRFYYNPVTSKLEPVGFDSDISASESVNQNVRRELIDESFPKYLNLGEEECVKETNETICKEKEERIEGWPELFFKDRIFFEKYIQELERISQKEWLDNLFEENKEEIQRSLDILHKEFPYYHFNKEIIYENQNFVRRALDIPQGLNVFYDDAKDNKIILEIGNLAILPLKLENAVINNTVFSLDNEVILQPHIEGQVVDYKRIKFNIPSGFSWQDSLADDLKVRWRILGSKILRENSVLLWDYFDEDFLEEDIIRKKFGNDFSEFIEIDDSKKTMTIKKGYWILNESLVIPPGFTLVAREGTTLDLANNSTILSYSKLDFKGSKLNPIKITSSDKTGQGLVVLKAPESNLEYVEFYDLKNPDKDGWVLTGAVTFYESDVKIDNVVFSEMNAEDSLNIIRSKYEFKNSVIRDGSYDCFDNDFDTGRIENSEFINCGNDALDFSGSTIEVENTRILNQKDKGISVGEISNISVKNSEVNGGFVGVSSKDLSNVEIDGIKIKNAEYGFAIYQKKTEYGPANAVAKNVELLINKNDYIVEKGSSLSVNGRIILGSEKNVYKKLYPNG